MLFSRELIETVADFLAEQPVPLVVDPVMVASSGARLLQDDAVETLVTRLFPLAAVVTPNLMEAEALAGLSATQGELAERIHALGAPAVIVTGGHGAQAVDHLFDGERHIEIPVERYDVAATHGAGCTHSATLAASLAQGLSLDMAARAAARVASRCGSQRPRRGGRGRRARRRTGVERVSLSPGGTLAVLRERKPLVHQITNYVVMNETANATLALGALPVMAHAREEVEEMVGLAGALVLNIGTLSPHWVEAMVAAGQGASAAGTPVVLDPVGAGATRYRTDTARRILAEVDVTVLRGNQGEVATLVGVEAEVRGVESIDAARGAGRDRARLRAVSASSRRSPAPVDQSPTASARRRRERHEFLASVTGTGCMSSAITGCFLAAKPDEPLEAAAEALAAFGVAGEDAARDAKGPGSFHVGFYDALAALDPATLDGRAKIT